MIEFLLMIDDSEIDNMVHKKVVQKAAFAKDIVIKKSAMSALEYLNEIIEKSPEKVPNLIFLDIRMPEMDGFGFLAEFNKLPSIILQKTKIIMLSSSIDAEDHKKANESPYVIKFINKPLKTTDLESIEL
ncbi:MAG: response regulator [Bacteroidales bacterium]|nr:response regulator [Bacteroidales bacterium]